MEPLIKQILRAAASGRTLSWEAGMVAALPWVIRNCLGPMLCHVSGNGGEHSPCAQHEPLRGAELSAKVISKTLTAAMEEILDACVSRVERIVLLKGISISSQYYPLPHLRPMRDIDFLVEEKDLAVTEKILAGLGYQRRSKNPESFYRNMHHSMPFFHPRNNVWVEVHTDIFPPGSPLIQGAVFSRENLVANYVAGSFNGREVCRLSAEMQLLYTIGHWGFEYKTLGGCVALFDVVYLLQNEHQLDWDRILGWLDTRSITALVLLCLGYLQANQIIEIEGDIIHKLKSRMPASYAYSLAILHSIIEKHYLAGVPYGRLMTVNNVAIQWRTLLQDRSPLLNLLSIPLNILFPPKAEKRFNPVFQFQRIKNIFK